VEKPADLSELTTEVARAVKVAYLRFKGRHITVQLGLASMPQNEVTTMPPVDALHYNFDLIMIVLSNYHFS